MEQIIIFIIMGLIAVFFKNKSDQDKKEPRKPFSSPTKNGQTSKRLEDYSKEIFGDFRETENKRSEQRQSTTTPVFETIETYKSLEPKRKREQRKIEEISIEVKEVPAVPNQSKTGRFSTHNKGNAPIRKVRNEQLLPQDESELLRAIVFSEIIGPPKSKR